VSLPLSVRNTGDVPVEGVGIGIDAASELTPRQELHDCLYPASHHGRLAVCTFPHVRIAPGETVTFAPALTFTAPERRLRSAIRLSVWPLVLGPWPGDGWPPDGAPGDGPDLRPHRVSGTGPGPGTFTGARWISTDVELTTHADFAAVGATVHGAPGTTHRISVGVRNDGPGELAPHHEVRFVFTVPEGSSVVQQPMQPIDVDSSLPLCDHGFDGQGDDTYTCPLEGMTAGKTRTVDFTLRVTHPGTGRVQFAPPAHTDPHPSNNTAPVTVTP
jgi:hypothetical protein